MFCRDLGGHTPASRLRHLGRSQTNECGVGGG